MTTLYFHGRQARAAQHLLECEAASFITDRGGTITYEAAEDLLTVRLPDQAYRMASTGERALWTFLASLRWDPLRLLAVDDPTRRAMWTALGLATGVIHDVQVVDR